MYCICCKRNNVEPTNYGISSKSNKTEEELLWQKTKREDDSFRTINSAMVNNGIIQIIEGGYGSVHDGDQIILAICDDCISKNLDDATLLYHGSYMPVCDDSIKSKIESSKKKYNRRKNIDKLI